jgi:integrase
MGAGLSVKKVEKLLRQGAPGRHTDGDVKGLMLCIENKSSAHWLLRWQRDGRVRHMGLGSARDLPLAAAREKAREQRERIARDVDPLQLKRAERAARIAAEAKLVTFRRAAERYHEAHEKGWTRHYANEFLSSLERWAYKHIGSLDVAAISKHDVLKVLEQPTRQGGTFWHTHVTTADRVRNRIERTLDYAQVREWRSGDNCARWRNYLENVLPAPRKVATITHLPSLPYAQVPQLMAKLAADEGVTAKALRFTILTAVRINEALGARWDEIDLALGEWRIPKERMKARKPHTVPLGPQAVSLLRSLYTEPGNPHVFVGTRPGTATAANTVLQALRRAGRKETIHGMRSAFSDWAHERTNFPGLIVELSLAHRVGNAVENAYRRTDLAVKRAKLMQAWGKYCCTPPVASEKDNVLTMRGQA